MSENDRLDVLRQEARTALDTLPMDQRAVYLLCALDELSLQAVAFRLGLTVPEVEATLAAALVAIDRQIRPGMIQ